MYGQGDVDGIAELLTKESILLAPGHSPAVGRGDVVALTRTLMDTEAADGVSVAWQSQNAVISSSGDIAFDYGRATSTLADGSVIEGSYLVVWIKQDGKRWPIFSTEHVCLVYPARKFGRHRKYWDTGCDANDPRPECQDDSN